jgi:hypothetical protein
MDTHAKLDDIRVFLKSHIMKFTTQFHKIRLLGLMQQFFDSCVYKLFTPSLSVDLSLKVLTLSLPIFFLVSMHARYHARVPEWHVLCKNLQVDCWQQAARNKYGSLTTYRFFIEWRMMQCTVCVGLAGEFYLLNTWECQVTHCVLLQESVHTKWLSAW